MSALKKKKQIAVLLIFNIFLFLQLSEQHIQGAVVYRVFNAEQWFVVKIDSGSPGVVELSLNQFSGNLGSS